MNDHPAPATRPIIVRSARRASTAAPVEGSPAASPQGRPVVVTSRDPSDVRPVEGSPASLPNGITPVDDGEVT